MEDFASPARLHVVLVEPEIPQNTGNIARTCAVTGASLHLVRPLGFPLDDKKLRHAGLDYWQYLDLHVWDSLPDFFAHNKGDFYYFSTKAQRSHTQPRYENDCFLFFGRESAGLPEALLFDNSQRCVRIPMMDSARSLNLANSVAVGVYEVLRQWDFPQLSCSGELRDFDWAKAKREHPDSQFL